METAQYLDQWTTQKVSYNKRDLILYSLGIGATDLRFAYENDSDFAAFPTYPLALLFKGTDQDVLSFPSPAMMEGPPLIPLPGVKVGLDGERYVEMIRPLDPEGGELTLKSRLIGCHKRGSGASVETEAILSDAKGPLYRIVSGAFLVGPKDFKDSGVTNSEVVETPKRAPDATVEVQTHETMPLLFRLSGDYNPLHVQEDMAQMSGFERPIMHGLNNFGICCRTVLKTCLDNDATRFKAIKGRFASPVLPGQTLKIDMWKDEAKSRIVFSASVKETGKICINNAYVAYKPAAKL